MTEDYYAVLGVPADASQDGIKAAYRSLARQYHPDANSGSAEAEERFKKITVAYEALSDPDKRRRYDLYGPDGVSASGQRGFGFDDVFEAFFGRGGGPFGFGGAGGGPPPGEDAVVDLHLEFTEAVFGSEHDVEVRLPVPCDACEASGAAPGTHAGRCATCAGRGEVQQVRRTILGQMVTSFPCPDCEGRGERVTNPCPACRGEGRRPETATVKVTVPAGIEDANSLRLSGRGAAGRRGGPAGDLYVRLGVAPPPPGWSRSGDDLHYSLAVPLTVAALGGHLDVTPLDGDPIGIDVPAGTQPGAVVRFRRRGVPHVQRSGRGDLLVSLDVAVPEDLDEEQEALLRELAELRGDPVAEPEAGMLGRIRRAFR